MKKTNYLFLCLISLCGVASVPLFAQPMHEFANNERRYVYDVSYKNFYAGQIIRELQHEGRMITVNTTADLSLWFYRLAVEQLSQIYWDDVSQLFLSKQFVRNSIGFVGETVQADFLKSGHQTYVIRNGKPYEFVNKKEKIIDFNAVGVQVSEGLKAEQTHFEFYMQTSDSVKHYFFEVTGKELVQTKFGKLQTYRLQQTHKKDRTLILWFSPEINYQIVKFRYKYNLMDLHGVLTAHSDINL